MKKSNPTFRSKDAYNAHTRLAKGLLIPCATKNPRIH
jgi:hypothetical protein